MPEQLQESMKGTTTLGIVFKDGVILATDKRATMGYMIASKKAKKVYKVADRIGLTTAGGVGDAQQLARILTVECQSLPDSQVPFDHGWCVSNASLESSEPEPFLPVLRTAAYRRY